MDAQEARRIAEDTKEHMLSEVATYANNVVMQIKRRIEEAANAGLCKQHFRHCPDSGVPYVVKSEVLATAFDQLEDEGYVIELSDAKKPTPQCYDGSFTISW